MHFHHLLIDISRIYDEQLIVNTPTKIDAEQLNSLAIHGLHVT